LEVEKIHACKNDCILYRGIEYENLENALFIDSTDSIVEKAVVMMRTAIEEKTGLKRCFGTYHSSFEVLVCKQKGVRIVEMAQSEA
jgi:hypothetical protein